MIFDENTASELQVRLKLHNVTIERWRATGRIPQKYFKSSEIQIKGMDLRTARKYLNLSQSVVCGLLKKEGCSVQRNTLLVWEQGVHSPQPFNLKALKKIYSELIDKKREWKK